MSLSAHISKDQPWLLRESGKTGCAAQNAHVHCSIVLSVSGTHDIHFASFASFIPNIKLHPS